MLTKKNKHIALKVKNLSIGYTSKKGQSIVASHLNMEIEKGAFVCLLGKNGIGKSTLLRTLSKIQPFIDGEIILNDIPLYDYSANELAQKISLVMTEKLPESNLTVFELIALGRQPYTNWIGKLSEKDIEKINLSMEQTHIEHLSNSKFYELSDGQLQRVLISRALAQDTDIIILDEPTAHLDVQHKMETFQLLKNLAEKLHKTILVSSHEIHQAIQSATELWLMTDEKLIVGKPQELIENGNIEKLFTSENIVFNKKNQQVVLKNHETSVK